MYTSTKRYVFNPLYPIVPNGTSPTISMPIGIVLYALLHRAERPSGKKNYTNQLAKDKMASDKSREPHTSWRAGDEVGV